MDRGCILRPGEYKHGTGVLTDDSHHANFSGDAALRSSMTSPSSGSPLTVQGPAAPPGVVHRVVWRGVERRWFSYARAGRGEPQGDGGGEGWIEGHNDWGFEVE